MKLADKYGTDRLDCICESILRYTSEPTIRVITSSLKNGYGNKNADSNDVTKDTSNAYGITRGEAYFRRDGGKK